MQIVQRKRWPYAIMVVWCVASAGVQLSTLKHWPVIQASEESTLNAAEVAYCQLSEVRDEKYFATLPNGELMFVLTADKNTWLCKSMVRQHNREFAIALFWIFVPPALALLALWFPPSFSRRRS